MHRIQPAPHIEPDIGHLIVWRNNHYYTEPYNFELVGRIEAQRIYQDASAILIARNYHLIKCGELTLTPRAQA